MYTKNVNLLLRNNILLNPCNIYISKKVNLFLLLFRYTEPIITINNGFLTKEIC